MKIEIIPGDEVVKEDKRNSKKTYLPTDALCVRCGCINNHFWYSDCVVCECNCGNDDIFIAGKLGIDLRLLLDLGIEEIKMMCETRGYSCSTRSVMTVRLLRDFHWFPDFDKIITKELIRKILKRNKKKFRFTVDLVNEVSKIKKDIRFKLVDEKDMLK